MNIKDLNGVGVCIVGFGREGRAMRNALREYAPQCKVAIADRNASAVEDARADVDTVYTGDAWLEDLRQWDVAIVSPGIPPAVIENAALPQHVTSSTQIFFDTVQAAGARIVGVTGSKGKSTTTSVLHAILLAGGVRSHLVGNIGEPAIAHLGDAAPDTVFAMELSSYQLQHLTVSPHIAVVTSFFPEHLDYHGSLEAYRSAKENICRWQHPDDTVLYDATSEGARQIASVSAGHRIPVHANDLPLESDALTLRGEHNRRNAALAYRAAAFWNIPDSVAVPVIAAYEGLAHRLQTLGSFHGITWVDDAISTTPDSTIAALDALREDVDTIILGGHDRGVPMEELGKRIAASSVRTVLLFPGSGPRIRTALQQAGSTATMHDVASMEEAISIARSNTKSGKTCLLSTASPSYGMYKNFEEKGEEFARCVREA